MLHLAINRHAKTIAGYLMFFFAFTSYANATPCSINLSSSTVSVSWTSDFTFQKVDFLVNKTNTEACSIQIGFSKGNSPTYSRYATYQSNNFNYQIYQDTSLSNPLKDGIDIATSADSINVTFPVGPTSRTLSYYIQAPTAGTTYSKFLPAGTYLDSYIIHTYDASSLTTPLSASTVNFSLIDNQILTLSLVPVGYAFNSNSLSQTIDLGNLEYARHGEMDLLVQSNVNYNIKVSSVNGGKLVNSAYPSGNNVIGYTFKINGTTVPVSTVPTDVSLAHPTTSTSGDVNRLSVDTAAANNVSVGTYSDSIKISIDLSP